MNNFKFNQLSLGVCLILLGTLTNAAELNNFDADQQIRQQQRDQALEKQLQPEPVVQTGLEKQLITQPQLQYLKSHSEKLCFEIKKFVLIGDDARKFTFAMRPVIQGEHNLIGRCIGV
ncbi:ShlB/FhaC/HecB family hemolysin secretion/activation protein, partial [Acinetobacter bereziniae]